MFRHFPGSLIQSGLDLKALNRNKPGRHRSRLDSVTAFLMLVFQGGFVFLLHDFPCNCGITGTGFGYLVSWSGACVCTRVCEGGREKEMDVLKSLEILSKCIVQWVGKWDSDANENILGGRKSKLNVYIDFFSSVFPHQKINVWPPPRFFEQSMEEWAVQSVKCSQPRVPGSDYLWKVQESVPELVYWAGRSQRAQEGARSRKHAEYVLSASVIMRTLKSNRITTSKDFSISSVNKGTDQRKTPVWMVCLGSSSSRSPTLCGDSRRYKQNPSPGISIKICGFTARQRHCFDITDFKPKVWVLVSCRICK